MRASEKRERFFFLRARVGNTNNETTDRNHRKDPHLLRSQVSKDPALDWLVQFGSAKTASDFVIALKVLQEAAKKAV